MDRKQADAVAQTILAPDVQVQEQLRARRVLEVRQEARRRKVAVVTLLGCGVGAAVAYLYGARPSLGIVWGGIVSAACAWLALRRAAP